MAAIAGALAPAGWRLLAGRGSPRWWVPDGLDCIVLEFDSPETMPPQFRDRKIFWYDLRSGVRTSKEEMETLAQTIAGMLNKARGPVKVVVPLRGWSETDGKGAPLHEPETSQVFIAELKRLLRSQIEVIDVDAPINEPEFAEAAVATLDEMMHRGK